jgi:hypothetical protein
MMYIHVFIWVSDHSYINICIFNVWYKKNQKLFDRQSGRSADNPVCSFLLLRTFWSFPAHCSPYSPSSLWAIFVCILTTLQFVYARLIFAKHRACKLQENLDGHRSPARLHYDSVMEWKNQPAWLYLLNQTKLNQTHVHGHVSSTVQRMGTFAVILCLYHACHLYPQIKWWWLRSIGRA